MTTLDAHEIRVTAFETDTAELGTRFTVLESTVEKGFASLEKRFDRLEEWPAERL